MGVGIMRDVEFLFFGANNPHRRNLFVFHAARTSSAPEFAARTSHRDALYKQSTTSSLGGTPCDLCGAGTSC